MSEKRDRAAWIKANGAQCNLPPQRQENPLRFVLLGAPGVGKGTQAEFLCERLGTCHLSTGDVFRAARCLTPEERSPALDAALHYMQRGDLVPDTTVLDLIRERTRCLRCGGGILLDGFPRTVAQAEALQNLLRRESLELDGVLDYRLPIEEIVTRLGGRRTCATCKAVYHQITLPPKADGVCDQCGGALEQREDDRPESVRVRMDAYARSTAPLTAYYQATGKLIPLSAAGSPEQIFERTITALQRKPMKYAG
jgi:adenylate kinase